MDFLVEYITVENVCFEFLTVMTTDVAVLWDVAPCRRFIGPCCLDHQDPDYGESRVYRHQMKF